METTGRQSWARKMTACPHCGRTVLFDGEGRCPECRVAGDAPVTAEDEARIAEVARRAAEPQGARGGPPDDGSPDDLTGFFVGAIFGLLGVAYVRLNPHSDRYRRVVQYGFLASLLLYLGLLGLGVARS